MNWVRSCGASLLIAGLFGGLNVRADESVFPPKIPTVKVSNANFIRCNEPRPEICYEIHAPVCAVRKLNVQCRITPCVDTEQKTYANDCQACSDQQVIGFAQGGECF